MCAFVQVCGVYVCGMYVWCVRYVCVVYVWCVCCGVSGVYGMWYVCLWYLCVVWCVWYGMVYVYVCCTQGFLPLHFCSTVVCLVSHLHTVCSVIILVFLICESIPFFIPK